MWSGMGEKKKVPLTSFYRYPPARDHPARTLYIRYPRSLFLFSFHFDPNQSIYLPIMRRFSNFLPLDVAERPFVAFVGPALCQKGKVAHELERKGTTTFTRT